MAGWQFIPGAKEMGPMVNAINSAIFLWLGFYVKFILQLLFKKYEE